MPEYIRRMSSVCAEKCFLNYSGTSVSCAVIMLEIGADKI